MPILAREPDLFPDDLLDRLFAASGPPEPNGDPQPGWWVLYTLSRQEKELMRRLRGLEVPFYGPLVSRRYRSPAGRIRASYMPLFANYVFMYGDGMQRYAALTTNCVCRSLAVADGARLTRDLRRVRRLIDLGRPLTPEARLESGMAVRIKSGVFAGFEGMVIRRDKKTRLLVAVKFIQQGVSVELDDCQLERID